MARATGVGADVPRRRKTAARKGAEAERARGRDGVALKKQARSDEAGEVVP
jgi:hypothetical protein